MIYKKANPT